MTARRNHRRFLLLALGLALLVPSTADARKSRVVYHATKKAYQGIAKSGRLDMGRARMGRVGKSAYFSLSKKGALRERPNAKAVWKGRISRGAWKKRVDTRRMKAKQLKEYSGLKDLRGTRRNGVMNKKLGTAVWKRAQSEGRIVVYKGRGAKKRAWSNVAVPAQVYDRRSAVSRLTLAWRKK